MKFHPIISYLRPYLNSKQVYLLVMAGKIDHRKLKKIIHKIFPDMPRQYKVLKLVKKALYFYRQQLEVINSYKLSGSRAAFVIKDDIEMQNYVKEHWLNSKAIFKRVKSKKFQMTYTTTSRIKCADGFSFSAQAGDYLYCAPRTFLEDGNYTAWELGFPSAPDELITPFAEDESKLTDTVYGYVPTEIVNQLIAKHGGFLSPIEDKSVKMDLILIDKLI